MQTLARHELFHADGRRLLVYGALQGNLDDRPASEEPQAIHKCLDVFTSSWVGIALARNTRPLDSAVEAAEACPFCPGRAEVPFPYEAAVFDNRFPSFRAAPPTPFGLLSPTEIARVLAVWIDRARELWSDPAHAYVWDFENRGSEVGATIAHPHGQVYALDHVPPVTAAKAAAHRRHRERAGTCLSCEATVTDARSERVVSENGSFVVAVPFAARWPFEVAVRARRHELGRLAELTPTEQRDLALALRDVVRRYDALFGFPLPYMMVAQEAPAAQPDWHLAFELYPLYRAPGVTKIRASVETGLGLFLNDVAPEDAARRLTALAVPAEPIELDTLFTVVQPHLAQLT